MIKDRDFTLSNTQGAQFAANFTVTTALGSISIPRAWVSVDVTFDKGDKALIVSTHLEPLLHLSYHLLFRDYKQMSC